MRSLLLLFASLLLLHGQRCAGFDTSKIYPRLTIASFNIQNFGTKKFDRKNAADVIKKIITRYDLICLQEIVAQKNKFLRDMLKDINKISSQKQYGMLVSPPMGTNTSRENYVFLYRTDRLVRLKMMVYPDPKKRFFRPPFLLHLQSPTTRSTSSFVAVCVHVKPNNTVKEIDALAHVYDYGKTIFGNENCVILGDFNAACRNLRANDWSNISLWTRPEFVWLINNSVDTTTYTSSCAYDRIIITGREMKQDTVYDSVRALDFEAEYNLTQKLAREISDHYPVEFQLRGKVPTVITENILMDVCLKVVDKRTRESSYLSFESVRQDYDFTVCHHTNGCAAGWTITRKAISPPDLISWLRDLNNQTNNVLSDETIETVRFQAEHGSLFRSERHGYDSALEYTLKVECNLTGGFCTVYLCRQTCFD